MPALAGGGGAGAAGGVLGIIPEHSLLDSCTRLSISLEESVFKVRIALIIILLLGQDPNPFEICAACLLPYFPTSLLGAVPTEEPWRGRMTDNQRNLVVMAQSVVFVG